MLIETNASVIAAFKVRKRRQWERACEKLPGLQLVSSSQHGTQIMVVYSTETFYEGVIIGQLPHLDIQMTGSLRNPVRRDRANEQKPLDRRSIDLSDDEIDKVVARWREGMSAISLPFVDAVFARSGLRMK